MKKICSLPVIVLLFNAMLFTISNKAAAQSTDIAGPPGSGQFGYSVTMLPNGNYVVCDPYFDDGAVADVGAVYLYNGSTNALISTLKGSTANDKVGSWGITVLTNGNFVVSSIVWHNGSESAAGAVTLVNGTTGLSGIVSSSNSLVGTVHNSEVGYFVYALLNGNYVVNSRYWNNGTFNQIGAITWGNGITGITGAVSSSNSLVGTNVGDWVGEGGITILSNSNYVVNSYWWNGVGAATWCSGVTGKTGFINSSNSLIGVTSGDDVGYGGIVALANGNYVVSSPHWNKGAISSAGAVTWCNGTTGKTGLVTTANSLTGNTIDDNIGNRGVTGLTNGNYVVCSPNWDNAANSDAGAVTWCNGTTGTTGIISIANSLVGPSVNDSVGIMSPTPLNNGNYVVCSPYWDNGITNVGAATLCNGTTGTFGAVSTGNSLVGSTANDNVGSGGVKALNNNNYVIGSPEWDNGTITDAGAVTWCSSSGLIGTVNTSNSLVGNNDSDNIGSGGIAALSNGNYVVASPNWNNGILTDVGAATWCNGTTGLTGVINSINSLVGSNNGDSVGYNITAINNGNYVVASPDWDNGSIVNTGAATWCNGTTGLAGTISNINSLVGNIPYDALSFSPLYNYFGYSINNNGVNAFTNGNYMIASSYWDNGSVVDGGAVSLCNGSTGLSGTVTSCNSVLGTAAAKGYAMTYAFNYTNNYLIVGRPYDNIVTIFDATGMLLANSNDVQTVNINGTNTVPLISSSGCRIIGTITPNGASPVSGVVSARAWIEPSVPNSGGDPFVARHYEITPATNASTATARVTLYFTQQEFTDFNNYPASTLDLPTGPSDVIGKANLRIGKFGGTSSNGTGLPGTYAGTASVIDPADADIVWNNNHSRWEVSFDVTGFSGFIVQTKPIIIPLTLLEFTGHLVNNNAELNWKTNGEVNTRSFDIERSTDGRIYSAVGNIAAVDQPGIQQYGYIDRNIVSLGVPVIYYRLKQKDIDGHFTYSPIVTINIDKKNIIIFYPNPVTDKANITISTDKPEQVLVKLIDNTGSIIQQETWQLYAGSTALTMNVSNLAKGMYYLELKGATINYHKQFIKQ